MPTLPPHAHYVIIGAGIHGLSTAMHLAQKLKAKGTPLHEATVVGDTVGDPFKDTSSVALNPVIKFTTLFGLLAVELAVSIGSTTGQLGKDGPLATHVLAAVFFLISVFFVWRSFHKMRIGAENVPIPFGRSLEPLVVPDAPRLAKAVAALVRRR